MVTVNQLPIAAVGLHVSHTRHYFPSLLSYDHRKYYINNTLLKSRITGACMCKCRLECRKIADIQWHMYICTYVYIYISIAIAFYVNDHDLYSKEDKSTWFRHVPLHFQGWHYAEYISYVMCNDCSTTKWRSIYFAISIKHITWEEKRKTHKRLSKGITVYWRR